MGGNMAIKEDLWNPDLEKQYDVIIVGGGPAGAATAKGLTRAGLKSIIIEKEKLPRYKCCSGVLFGEAQVLIRENFGELPKEGIYANPLIIKASNVLGFTEKEGFFQWYWEYPKEGKTFPKDYINVWRNKFDYWLLEQSGAYVKDECSLHDFTIQKDHVKVKCRQKDGKIFELTGNYLVGADGGYSRTRQLLDPSFREQYDELAVYQAYYECLSMDLKKDHWYVFIDKSLGDLMASMHTKDDMLVLCVGGMKGKNLKPYFDNFLEFLRSKFNVKVGKFVRQEGCIMNNMFLKALFHQGKDRVLLVGEAAGFLHMNGSGIDTALSSGLAAADAIAQCYKTGEDALSIYIQSTEDIRNHIKICAANQQIFRR